MRNVSFLLALLNNEYFEFFLYEQSYNFARGLFLNPFKA